MSQADTLLNTLPHYQAPERILTRLKSKAVRLLYCDWLLTWYEQSHRGDSLDGLQLSETFKCNLAGQVCNILVKGPVCTGLFDDFSHL